MAQTPAEGAWRSSGCTKDASGFVPAGPLLADLGTPPIGKHILRTNERNRACDAIGGNSAEDPMEVQSRLLVPWTLRQGTRYLHAKEEVIWAILHLDKSISLIETPGLL